jgi:hypothetical protein
LLAPGNLECDGAESDTIVRNAAALIEASDLTTGHDGHSEPVPPGHDRQPEPAAGGQNRQGYAYPAPGVHDGHFEPVPPGHDNQSEPVAAGNNHQEDHAPAGHVGQSEATRDSGDQVSSYTGLKKRTI